MTITVYVFFFVFSELRWEVIVCFVDIGGIDYHYCLSFLSCVQWVKMRGHKKESLNSNGNQFHQYQQNKQSPLILTHWTQERKHKQ
jgi:hypothetical protein